MRKRDEWNWLSIESSGGLWHYTCWLHMIRVIKSRRTREAGHVACMEEMRNAYKMQPENLKRRNN